MTITRDDVANLAGVSSATVSYVINNGPRRVTDDTRRKVEKAIDKLGYQPSAVARSLKTKKTLTIGIVISDIRNPIFAFIAQTIEDELVSAGYNLILCNTKELAERESHYLQMLMGKQADGVVVAATGANPNIMFSMFQSGKRIVLIDRCIEGLEVPSVLFDNENGAYSAVSHLISLGHTRIGFLNLPPELTPGAGRYRGYMRAMRDAGLPISSALMRSGKSTAEEAQALAQNLLSLDEPPTAMFVSSNRLARGVLMYIKEHRLAMPDDIALCVFDDIGYYSYTTPSITAVAHDYREFGVVAARLLIEELSGQDHSSAQIVTLPHRLNVRESTIGKGLVGNKDSVKQEPISGARVPGTNENY